jgi:hypothetical protein
VYSSNYYHSPSPDADAVLSSTALSPHFNRDHTPMCFRDPALTHAHTHTHSHSHTTHTDTDRGGTDKDNSSSSTAAAAATASDVVSYLEEALYIDSLLARAALASPALEAASEAAPAPAPASASAAYQRGGLCCLLNASYAPLPPALPAVVCAVGYVIR